MKSNIKSSNHQRESQKRAVIFLLLTMGTCLVWGMAAILSPVETKNAIYSALQKGFTAIPILSVLLTRYLTKDKSGWNISLRVWKNGTMLLFSALLPGAAVLLGAGIYYMIFPHELYGNVQSLFDFCAQYGLPANISVNSNTILTTAIVLWLTSVLAIPIHLLELGEEIGWRGYLLPQFLSFMDAKKAVLVSGALWGITHAH